MSVQKAKIADLIPDDANFNKGTEFGNGLIEKSLSKFGAGRSILLDKNNRIIAGNKTIDNAAANGFDDVLIVETDGKSIVAVKRTDVDLDTKQGREMALADNATAKANIDWDTDAIANWELPAEQWGVDISLLSDDLTDTFTLPDGDKPGFQQLTFTLSDAQAETVKAAIDKATAAGPFVSDNENRNGNALARIAESYV